MHWVVRQGLCLAAGPGWVQSHTDSRSKALWVQGSPTCAHLRRVLQRNSSASAPCGAGWQWGHQGHPSVSPAHLLRSSPALLHPAALPGRRCLQSNSKWRQTKIPFSPFPAQLSRGGCQGRAGHSLGHSQGSPALSWQAGPRSPVPPWGHC